MTRHFTPPTRTVTIANSATVSDAEATGMAGVTIVGIITAASLTGTSFTFQVSMDNSTFVALEDSTGAAVTVTVESSRAYYVDPIIFLAWNYVKVVSGSAESGGDTITLVLGVVQ